MMPEPSGERKPKRIQRKRTKGWHKVGFRMFQRKQIDLYDAIIFSSPRFLMWAWIVWHSGGQTSGIVFSLKEARRHANGIITNLEAINAKQGTSRG